MSAPPDGGMASPDAAELTGTPPSRREGTEPVPFELSIAPPEIPWLADGEPEVAPPVLTPCPTGWNEVDDELGLTTCEPWPSTASVECPPGQAQLPGDSGGVCASLGPACPTTGDYASDLPTGRPIVHVLATASAGGDGSLASPYATLSEVPFTSLAADTVVALGEGTYAGPVVLPVSVALWGACAEGTELVAAPADGPEAVVTVGGPGVSLHNLRLSVSGRVGIQVDRVGAEFELAGVEVRGASCQAILAEGAVALRADELAVVEMGACATGFGVGLALSAGAQVEVRHALLAPGRGMAVSVLADLAATALTLEDSVMRSSDTGGVLGMVLSVPDPATGFTARATVSRTLFEELSFQAVAIGAGAELRLEESAVRDGSSGVAVARGAMAEVRRTSVARIDTTAFLVNASTEEDRTEAVFEDVVVTDNRLGTPFSVEEARVEMRRMAVARSRGSADIIAEGADILVEDVRLGYTDASPDLFIGEDGRPVLVGGGMYAAAGTVQARRLIVEEARMIGITLLASSDFETGEAFPLDATFEDVAVRDTSGLPVQGEGIQVSGHVTLELRRALFERSHHAGMLLTGVENATIEDVVVRDTGSSEDTGLFGRGLWVQGGVFFEVGEPSTVRVRRAEFMGQRDVGVFVHGNGTRAWLEDIAVETTEVRDCASDEVACHPAGHGLGVYGGSAVEAGRFSISTSDLCGLQLAQGAELDLSQGRIRGALIGACIQIDDYDLGRLSEGVRYEDNGTNLQSTRLPVPDAIESL